MNTAPLRDNVRTLVLTGASRGIGHATVKKFSAGGWRVITISRQPFSALCPWPSGGENHVQTAIEAGAMGFLLKNATAEEMARAIRTANRGSRVLAPEATDALVQSMRHDPTPGDDLTTREREVLNLIVCGYNNTEIAERLFLSVSTVKFHVSAILSKLGVSNRIEAVALAIQSGLVKRVA